jgi:hypothetical protein
MSEFEYSGIDHIPFDHIVGWWYPIKLHPKNQNEVDNAEHHPNPRYKGDRNYSMDQIKPKPELAHFPAGHPALKEEPWKSLPNSNALPSSSSSKGKGKDKSKGKANNKGKGKNQGLSRRSITVLLRLILYSHEG